MEKQSMSFWKKLQGPRTFSKRQVSVCRGFAVVCITFIKDPILDAVSLSAAGMYIWGKMQVVARNCSVRLCFPKIS